MRQAFVFDVNRCTGCQACQLACTIENGLEPDRSWRAINTFNERRHPDIPLFHLSLACNHCADPACMRACPALAYSVDSSSGAVLIDERACIGCGYCAWACPYGAPRLDLDRGVMTKCTFCNHRLAEGLAPACAALCPTGALTVAPLPEDQLVQPVEGFPRTDLRPALKVVPPRQSLGAAAASMGIAAPSLASVPFSRPAESKISLKKEWPVAVFTWLACVMFAVLVLFAVAQGALLGFAAPLAPPAMQPQATYPWPPAAAFAATALAAMLLGGAHLGRKARAWRIVLNVAGSPLSREIVAFTSFAALGTGYLWLAAGSAPVAILAVASGFAALVTIEDVYRYALKPVPRLPHSANVVGTGPFLAAVLLSGVPPFGFVAVGLGIAKASLYMFRKVVLARRGDDWRPLISACRLGLGLALPASAATLGVPFGVLVACVLAGELIDRCELYDELEIMTPRLQMARDLAARQHLANE